jgi:Zn-dependent protease
MIGDIVVQAALYAVPLLLGVVTHEVAHGWVANKLGDPTAKDLGRITLNPLVHIDLMGTVILPLILLLVHSPFLFGWAKPVPVNFDNLRGGRRDMALVAISGPLTNLMMAVLSAVVYHLILSSLQNGWIPAHGRAILLAEPLFMMARLSVTFNLVLMVINLLPIPPLDGGRVMVGILPYRLAYQLERLETFGMLIVLLLIGTGLWRYFVSPVLDVFLRFFLDR